uniref:DIX domain-containing protein n=1 Tax=Panagrolaimus sp. PS1159 TaxID=55785 RepID=A0AC35FIC9_9BILA
MNEDCQKFEQAKMALIKSDSELFSPTSVSAATTAPSGFTLNAILSDREALDVFRAWMLSDPNRSADGLDLYFAIQGFKQAAQKNDPKSLAIASQLHRRFISLNSGSCDFIYHLTRVEISNKVHRCVKSNSFPNPTIFDASLKYLSTFLQQQYALFIDSQEFNEFINRYSNGFGQIPPSDIDYSEHCYVNEETFEEMTLKHPGTIASSSVVGSSVVDDDLQPSTSSKHHQLHYSRNTLDESNSLRKAYAQQNGMTKSEPDVNKKFNLISLDQHSSTDDGFNGKGYRNNRKENREKQKYKEKQNQHSGMPHDRPEQRIEFANILTQKLSAIADEIAILERHFDKQIFAREIPEYRQKILQSQSFHQQQQQQQQPSYINQPQMASNPSAFKMWGQSSILQQQQLPLQFQTSSSQAAKSIAEATICATSGFDADEEDIDYYESKIRGNDRSNSISPAPCPIPIRDRRFSPYGNGGFAPPPPANSNKSASTTTTQHPQYPRYEQNRQQYPYMGSTYMPQYLSFSDSSGFFSGESNHGNPTSFIDPARMKKLYEKARETNAQASSTISAPNAPTISNHHQMNHIGHSQTLMRKTSAVPNQVVNHQQSQTLPRPSRPTGNTNEMTVSLREPGQMAFVSKCEPKPITLREFRHLFGVSSRSTKRFFFKSSCEDGEDPYQWNLIDGDDQIVPMFEGKVVCECRTMSDSD